MVRLTNNPSSLQSNLSSQMQGDGNRNQLMNDALVEGMAHQAGDMASLTAMSLGSLAFTNIRALSAPLLSTLIRSSAGVNAGSWATALMGEVAVFRASSQALASQASPESWHDGRAFTATTLDFMLLKGFSHFMRGEHFASRHAVSALAMTSGEYAREATHLSDATDKNFSERFAHSVVASVALEAGGQITSAVTGGSLHRVERHTHAQSDLRFTETSSASASEAFVPSMGAESGDAIRWSVNGRPIHVEVIGSRPSAGVLAEIEASVKRLIERGNRDDVLSGDVADQIEGDRRSILRLLEEGGIAELSFFGQGVLLGFRVRDRGGLVRYEAGEMPEREVEARPERSSERPAAEAETEARAAATDRIDFPDWTFHELTHNPLFDLSGNAIVQLAGRPLEIRTLGELVIRRADELLDGGLTETSLAEVEGKLEASGLSLGMGADAILSAEPHRAAAPAPRRRRGRAEATESGRVEEATAGERAVEAAAAPVAAPLASRPFDVARIEHPNCIGTAASVNAFFDRLIKTGNAEWLGLQERANQIISSSIERNEAEPILQAKLDLLKRIVEFSLQGRLVEGVDAPRMIEAMERGEDLAALNRQLSAWIASAPRRRAILAAQATGVEVVTAPVVAVRAEADAAPGARGDAGAFKANDKRVDEAPAGGDQGGGSAGGQGAGAGAGGGEGQGGKSNAPAAPAEPDAAVEAKSVRQKILDKLPGLSGPVRASVEDILAHVDTVYSLENVLRNPGLLNKSTVAELGKTPNIGRKTGRVFLQIITTLEVCATLPEAQALFLLERQRAAIGVEAASAELKNIRFRITRVPYLLAELVRVGVRAQRGEAGWAELLTLANEAFHAGILEGDLTSPQVAFAVYSLLAACRIGMPVSEGGLLYSLKQSISKSRFDTVYEKCLEEARDFVAENIASLASFDQPITTLTAEGALSEIVRTATDPRLILNHMKVFVSVHAFLGELRTNIDRLPPRQVFALLNALRSRVVQGSVTNPFEGIAQIIAIHARMLEEKAVLDRLEGLNFLSRPWSQAHANGHETLNQWFLETTPELIPSREAFTLVDRALERRGDNPEALAGFFTALREGTRFLNAETLSLLNDILQSAPEETAVARANEKLREIIAAAAPAVPAAESSVPPPAPAPSAVVVAAALGASTLEAHFARAQATLDRVFSMRPSAAGASADRESEGLSIGRRKGSASGVLKSIREAQTNLHEPQIRFLLDEFIAVLDSGSALKGVSEIRDRLTARADISNQIDQIPNHEKSAVYLEANRVLNLIAKLSDKGQLSTKTEALRKILLARESGTKAETVVAHLRALKAELLLLLGMPAELDLAASKPPSTPPPPGAAALEVARASTLPPVEDLIGEIRDSARLCGEEMESSAGRLLEMLASGGGQVSEASRDIVTISRDALQILNELRTFLKPVEIQEIQDELIRIYDAQTLNGESGLIEAEVILDALRTFTTRHGEALNRVKARNISTESLWTDNVFKPVPDANVHQAWDGEWPPVLERARAAFRALRGPEFTPREEGDFQRACVLFERFAPDALNPAEPTHTRPADVNRLLEFFERAIRGEISFAAVETEIDALIARYRDAYQDAPRTFAHTAEGVRERISAIRASALFREKNRESSSHMNMGLQAIEKAASIHPAQIHVCLDLFEEVLKGNTKFDAASNLREKIRIHGVNFLNAVHALESEAAWRGVVERVNTHFNRFIATENGFRVAPGSLVIRILRGITALKEKGHSAEAVAELLDLINTDAQAAYDRFNEMLRKDGGDGNDGGGSPGSDPTGGSEKPSAPRSEAPAAPAPAVQAEAADVTPVPPLAPVEASRAPTPPPAPARSEVARPAAPAPRPAPTTPRPEVLRAAPVIVAAPFKAPAINSPTLGAAVETFRAFRAACDAFFSKYPTNPHLKPAEDLARLITHFTHAEDQLPPAQAAYLISRIQERLARVEEIAIRGEDWRGSKPYGHIASFRDRMLEKRDLLNYLHRYTLAVEAKDAASARLANDIFHQLIVSKAGDRIIFRAYPILQNLLEAHVKRGLALQQVNPLLTRFFDAIKGEEINPAVLAKISLDLTEALQEEGLAGNDADRVALGMTPWTLPALPPIPKLADYLPPPASRIISTPPVAPIVVRHAEAARPPIEISGAGAGALETAAALRELAEVRPESSEASAQAFDAPRAEAGAREQEGHEGGEGGRDHETPETPAEEASAQTEADASTPKPAAQEEAPATTTPVEATGEVAEAAASVEVPAETPREEALVVLGAGAGAPATLAALSELAAKPAAEVVESAEARIRSFLEFESSALSDPITRLKALVAIPLLRKVGNEAERLRERILASDLTPARKVGALASLRELIAPSLERTSIDAEKVRDALRELGLDLERNPARFDEYLRRPRSLKGDAVKKFQYTLGMINARVDRAGEATETESWRRLAALSQSLFEQILDPQGPLHHEDFAQALSEALNLIHSKNPVFTPDQIIAQVEALRILVARNEHASLELYNANLANLKKPALTVAVTAAPSVERLAPAAATPEANALNPLSDPMMLVESFNRRELNYDDLSGRSHEAYNSLSPIGKRALATLLLRADTKPLVIEFIRDINTGSLTAGYLDRANLFFENIHALQAAGVARVAEGLLKHESLHDFIRLGNSRDYNAYHRGARIVEAHGANSIQLQHSEAVDFTTAPEAVRDYIERSLAFELYPEERNYTRMRQVNTVLVVRTREDSYFYESQRALNKVEARNGEAVAYEILLVLARGLLRRNNTDYANFRLEYVILGEEAHMPNVHRLQAACRLIELPYRILLRNAEGVETLVAEQTEFGPQETPPPPPPPPSVPPPPSGATDTAHADFLFRFSAPAIETEQRVRETPAVEPEGLARAEEPGLEADRVEAGSVEVVAQAAELESQARLLDEPLASLGNFYKGSLHRRRVLPALTRTRDKVLASGLSNERKINVLKALHDLARSCFGIHVADADVLTQKVEDISRAIDAKPEIFDERVSVRRTLPEGQERKIDYHLNLLRNRTGDNWSGLADQALRLKDFILSAEGPSDHTEYANILNEILKLQFIRTTLHSLAEVKGYLDRLEQSARTNEEPTSSSLAAEIRALHEADATLRAAAGTGRIERAKPERVVDHVDIVEADLAALKRHSSNQLGSGFSKSQNDFYEGLSTEAKRGLAYLLTSQSEVLLQRLRSLFGLAKGRPFAARDAERLNLLFSLIYGLYQAKVRGIAESVEAFTTGFSFKTILQKQQFRILHLYSIVLEALAQNPSNHATFNRGERVDFSHASAAVREFIGRELIFFDTELKQPLSGAVSIKLPTLLETSAGASFLIVRQDRELELFTADVSRLAHDSLEIVNCALLRQSQAYANHSVRYVAIASAIHPDVVTHLVRVFRIAEVPYQIIARNERGEETVVAAQTEFGPEEALPPSPSEPPPPPPPHDGEAAPVPASLETDTRTDGPSVEAPQAPIDVEAEAARVQTLIEERQTAEAASRNFRARFDAPALEDSRVLQAPVTTERPAAVVLEAPAAREETPTAPLADRTATAAPVAAEAPTRSRRAFNEETFRFLNSILPSHAQAPRNTPIDQVVLSVRKGLAGIDQVTLCRTLQTTLDARAGSAKPLAAEVSRRISALLDRLRTASSNKNVSQAFVVDLFDVAVLYVEGRLPTDEVAESPAAERRTDREQQVAALTQNAQALQQVLEDLHRELDEFEICAPENKTDADFLRHYLNELSPDKAFGLDVLGENPESNFTIRQIPDLGKGEARVRALSDEAAAYAEQYDRLHKAYWPGDPTPPSTPPPSDSTPPSGGTGEARTAAAPLEAAAQPPASETAAFDSTAEAKNATDGTYAVPEAPAVFLATPPAPTIDAPITEPAQIAHPVDRSAAVDAYNRGLLHLPPEADAVYASLSLAAREGLRLLLEKELHEHARPRIALFLTHPIALKLQARSGFIDRVFETIGNLRSNSVTVVGSANLFREKGPLTNHHYRGESQYTETFFSIFSELATGLDVATRRDVIRVFFPHNTEVDWAQLSEKQNRFLTAKVDPGLSGDAQRYREEPTTSMDLRAVLRSNESFLAIVRNDAERGEYRLHRGQIAQLQLEITRYALVRRQHPRFKISHMELIVRASSIHTDVLNAVREACEASDLPVAIWHIPADENYILDYASARLRTEHGIQRTSAEYFRTATQRDFSETDAAILSPSTSIAVIDAQNLSSLGLTQRGRMVYSMLSEKARRGLALLLSKVGDNEKDITTQLLNHGVGYTLEMAGDLTALFENCVDLHAARTRHFTGAFQANGTVEQALRSEVPFRLMAGLLAEYKTATAILGRGGSRSLVFDKSHDIAFSPTPEEAAYIRRVITDDLTPWKLERAKLDFRLLLENGDSIGIEVKKLGADAASPRNEARIRALLQIFRYSMLRRQRPDLKLKHIEFVFHADEISSDFLRLFRETCEAAHLPFVLWHADSRGNYTAISHSPEIAVGEFGRRPGSALIVSSTTPDSASANTVHPASAAPPAQPARSADEHRTDERISIDDRLAFFAEARQSDAELDRVLRILEAHRGTHSRRTIVRALTLCKNLMHAGTNREHWLRLIEERSGITVRLEATAIAAPTEGVVEKLQRLLGAKLGSAATPARAAETPTRVRLFDRPTPHHSNLFSEFEERLEAFTSSVPATNPRAAALAPLLDRIIEALDNHDLPLARANRLLSICERFAAGEGSEEALSRIIDTTLQVHSSEREGVIDAPRRTAQTWRERRVSSLATVALAQRENASRALQWEFSQATERRFQELREAAEARLAEANDIQEAATRKDTFDKLNLFLGNARDVSLQVKTTMDDDAVNNYLVKGLRDFHKPIFITLATELIGSETENPSELSPAARKRALELVEVMKLDTGGHIQRRFIAALIELCGILSGEIQFSVEAPVLGQASASRAKSTHAIPEPYIILTDARPGVIASLEALRANLQFVLDNSGDFSSDERRRELAANAPEKPFDPHIMGIDSKLSITDIVSSTRTSPLVQRHLGDELVGAFEGYVAFYEHARRTLLPETAGSSAQDESN